MDEFEPGLLVSKNQDYSVEIQSVNQENRIKVLRAFWSCLQQIGMFNFKACSQLPEGWDRSGNGDVVVESQGVDRLIFNERGTWQNKQEGAISFRNAYRWTLDLSTGVISLEHLRRGHQNPVFLLQLVPSSNRSLSSTAPHLCRDDTYSGEIQFDQHSFHLNWKVTGPKKNEVIDYYYS